MKSISKGVVLSYVNTFLNMVIGLYMSRFLIRTLGDTDYGIYQTVSSFVNYLVLLEFGTGTIMVRNISLCRSRNASKEEIERNISTIWSIGNMLSALILAVSVCFYFLIDRIYAVSLTVSQIRYAKNIFIYVTANLIISFLWQTLKSVAMGYEDYTFSSKIAIIKLILRTLLLVVLLVPFQKAIVVAIVDAALSLLIFVYTYVYCIRKFRVRVDFSSFDPLILRSMLPLCLAVFLQAIMTQANNNVAKFLLGVMTSPETVSLYSIGLYVFSMCNSLTYLSVGLYAPKTAKVVQDSHGDGGRITEFMIGPSRLVILVSGAITFGFIAAGKPFVNILYGAEYIGAWDIAVMLMLPLVLVAPVSMAENLLTVLNKRLVRSVILFCTTVCNVLLTIVLIPRCGIIGAAFSTGFCNFLGQAALSNIYYAKVIGLRIGHLYKSCYKGILIFQIAGALAGSLVSAAISNQILAFIAGGSVFVVTAFGGYVLFGMNGAEKQMLGNMMRPFRKKKDTGKT